MDMKGVCDDVASTTRKKSMKSRQTLGSLKHINILSVIFSFLIIDSRLSIANGFLPRTSVHKIDLVSSYMASSPNPLIQVDDSQKETEAGNGLILDENNNDLQDRHLRFGGIGRLYATDTQQTSSTTNAESYKDVIDRLSLAKVVVVGLGGVGSWAAEALCRSGVGNLIMIDLDDICISNTNRQLHATSSTIGRMKLDEMERRLSDINPKCNITLIHDFVSVENVFDILDMCSICNKTVLLDAIDGTKEKSALLAACASRGIPVVTCGGAAGRMDPTKITYDDLTEATGDRLLSACRKNLRKFYGFKSGVSLHEKSKSKKKAKKWNIEAVFSTEIPKQICSSATTGSLRQCDGPLGTACFVTGSFGFLVAARVLHMIATDKLVHPTAE